MWMEKQLMQGEDVAWKFIDRPMHCSRSELHAQYLGNKFKGLSTVTLNKYHYFANTTDAFSPLLYPCVVQQKYTKQSIGRSQCAFQIKMHLCDWNLSFCMYIYKQSDDGPCHKAHWHGISKGCTSNSFWGLKHLRTNWTW
jgi:hypothetical protein